MRIQNVLNEMYCGQLFQREAGAGERPCILYVLLSGCRLIDFPQRFSGHSDQRCGGGLIMAQTMVHPARSFHELIVVQTAQLHKHLCLVPFLLLGYSPA